jgi:endonuclease/exonuclease/phosphatase family metal-dependent hydrolase
MTDQGQTLSVATYNVHRGVGRDRRLDHRRIARLILDLDVDVVALQEVETPGTNAPGAAPLLHPLRQQGYELLLGPTMRSERAAYGNALLSRLPVICHWSRDLSHPGREPRGLIEASLSLDAKGSTGHVPTRNGEIQCFATHLGLDSGERRRQIEWLVEQIDRQCRPAPAQQPIILLGDFNEWRRRPGRLMPIQARLQGTPARPTYPSCWPLLPLDRIWFGGGLRLQTFEVVKTPTARVASDHLPLRASFALAESS